MTIQHLGITENEIGKIIVDCAVRLHMELGPGLLETVYEVLLGCGCGTLFLSMLSFG